MNSFILLSWVAIYNNGHVYFGTSASSEKDPEIAKGKRYAELAEIYPGSIINVVTARWYTDGTWIKSEQEINNEK